VEASELTNAEARQSAKRGEPVNRPQAPVVGVPERAKCNLDDYVRDISTLRIENAKEAGGKGANLGELVAAELPVPPGFVLLRACYQDSMRAGGVSDELAAAYREALAKVGDSSQLGELCDRMQSLVLKAGITDDVCDRMLAAYRRFGPAAVVAVRSSATGEDGRDASFAGMNATITNVTGDDGLIVDRPSLRRTSCPAGNHVGVG